PAHAAYAACAGVALVVEWGRMHPLVNLLFTSVLFLATTVVPGLASRYWTQRRTLLHALQERNAQLERERAMVAGQARLRERQRIAQDMHDSLGHQLSLIAVHTGALEVDPALTERQRAAVAVLREASVTAMHELREVVGILRDGTPEPVRDAGPAARAVSGVEALVEASRSAGTTVELRRTGERRPLPAAAERAAYRIAQEALTNAHKHAPGAPIAVELRYEPDSLVVEVANGPATRPAGEVVSGGQGLTGLRERARLVGGMVFAGPVDGGGFRVAGVLPYGPGPVGSDGRGTTFVGVEDDFRQQSPTAAPGNAEPVSGWTGGSGWTVSEKELAMEIGRRSRGRGIALGCGITFGAVVLVLVAVGFGLFAVATEPDKGMIDPETYEAVRIGESEGRVRDRLPDGETWTTSGLDEGGPAKPAGSDCLVLMSSEMGSSWDSEPVFRFCFRDGKLIEKQSYEVKGR
ncbi:sensor histidine kinase, partial [Streptomyces sp. GC420]|uniref:sensor histidine kinase n=1 Tax=Streptomyces sp. GC420 TaxID=2697568 RepID=UPI001414E089